MDQAYLMLTDSGGIQEETPSLAKPVLVLPEVTERPEGVEAGCAALIGVHRHEIVAGVSNILDNGDVYSRMAKARDPYGDCQAANMIGNALAL